jgi:hypothetical protein
MQRPSAHGSVHLNLSDPGGGADAGRWAKRGRTAIETFPQAVFDLVLLVCRLLNLRSRDSSLFPDAFTGNA